VEAQSNIRLSQQELLKWNPLVDATYYEYIFTFVKFKMSILSPELVKMFRGGRKNVVDFARTVTRQTD
jgi:hypothetical protein